MHTSYLTLHWQLWITTSCHLPYTCFSSTCCSPFVCLLLCQLGFLLLTLGLPPFLSSSCPTNLIWLACTFIFSFISLSILQGSSHVQDVFKSHYNHNLNASMLFSVCLGIQCLGFWSAQQNCQLSEFSTKIPYSPICIYISNLQTIVNPHSTFHLLY